MEVPFYYRYLEGEFADIEMYNIACSFMDQYQSSLKGNKYSRCKNVGTVILKYLASLRIEEFSSDFIIQLMANSNFEAGEAIIINKFLLFMVDNDKIQDAIVKRIIFFKKRIEGMSFVDDFYRIFKYTRFDDFLNNNFFESEIGIMIFFRKIPKENFLDERLYEVLSNKLEEIKLSPEINNLYTMRRICNEFVVLAKAFFANVKLADITLKHLHTCIVSLKNLKSYAISRRLSEMLLLLESKGLIKDKEVLHLLSFKDYLLSDSCKLGKYIELTSGKNIKRFVCNTSNSRQQMVLQYMNIDCQEVFDAWVKFYEEDSYRASCTTFKTICTEFDDYLSEFTVESLEDINFDTFYAQIMYFGKYKSKHYISPITAFYMFLSQNYNPKIFEVSHVDIKLLQRNRIAEELLEGYKIIIIIRLKIFLKQINGY
ncbi:hypothetical protein [Clostridium sp. DJ247]|uniref:hypothetical protein n=1 Tax=Clostridium sp. DJ247 TaxID=2726188 RepID=UPI001627309D|nr:hypothetical protein [Clostridium sp. DJ247]MBC2579044.1 hypothetical protein [Clostridium sp. DJ247]